MRVISRIPMSFDAYQWDGQEDTLLFFKRRLGSDDVWRESDGTLTVDLWNKELLLEVGDWLTIDNRGCIYKMHQESIDEVTDWHELRDRELNSMEAMYDEELF